MLDLWQARPAHHYESDGRPSLDLGISDHFGSILQTVSSPVLVDYVENTC